MVGFREIVNKTELCTCIVLREEKAAESEERKERRVAPAGSRGTQPRVWSRGCTAQEYTPGKGSRWLQRHHLLAGRLF